MDVEALKARWKVREMFDCKQEVELQVLGWNIKEELTLEDAEDLKARWKVREMFDCKQEVELQV